MGGDDGADPTFDSGDVPSRSSDIYFDAVGLYVCFGLCNGSFSIAHDRSRAVSLCCEGSDEDVDASSDGCTALDVLPFDESRVVASVSHPTRHRHPHRIPRSTGIPHDYDHERWRRSHCKAQNRHRGRRHRSRYRRSGRARRQSRTSDPHHQRPERTHVSTHLPYSLGITTLTMCILFCVSRLNFQTTSARSNNNISPREEFTGRGIDHRLDYRCGFGEYAIATVSM